MALAQEGTDVIRGRVTNAEKKAVGDVSIMVWDSAGAQRETKTDKGGNFTVLFRGGSGVYIVQASFTGMQNVRRQLRRQADESVLIADLVLLPSTGMGLDTVRIRASRRRAPKPEDFAVAEGLGSTDRIGSTTGPGMAPGESGNLNKLAGSQPGVVMTPDGFSVLGLGADQNKITLNGLELNVADLPRGANISGALQSSTFDASRGGFSGAEMALTMRPGSSFIMRRAYFSLDAPYLQFSDAASKRLGQQYTNARISWSGSGPLFDEKLMYNASIQYGRRSSDLQSLGLDRLDVLQRVGVSADSVQRLFDLMRSATIPIHPANRPHANATNSFSTLSRIDHSSKDGTTSIGLLVSGTLNQSDGGMLSPTSVLAYGGKSTTASGRLQLSYQTYLRTAFLNETESAIALNVNKGTPYLRMPGARVLVTSDFADGESGISTLIFGGNTGLPSKGRSLAWDFSNNTSWYSLDSKHRLKLSLSSRVERSFQGQYANRYGTYAYNSLTDFESGTPASFSRTFDGRETSAGLWQFSTSLGDTWRKTTELQFRYGLRAEGNRYLSQPGYNSAVDSLFGVRTDHVPNTFHVSPRAGFTWIFKKSAQGRKIAQTGDFYTFSVTPPGLLTGGIGEFRNSFSPGTISSLKSSTGLPDGQRQLYCFGDEIPTPDWTTFGDISAIPTHCVSGTAPSLLSVNAPTVRVLSKDYNASRSWRGNLRIDYPIEVVSLSVEETYSMNFAQQSSVDLNFANMQRFSLPNEDDRPMFVTPASIIASTGLVSSGDARVSDAFSRVAATNSDLRSRSNRLMFRLSQTSLAPYRKFGRLYGGLSYTLSHSSAQQRGFSGTTAGNPFDVEWARSSFDSRHQIGINMIRSIKGISISAYSSISSGTPYTPLINGDINGDGYANDRAFIFDPNTTTDAAVASGMQSLLQGLDNRTKSCLEKQLGKIAKHNSCTGPWSQSLSLSASISGRSLGTSDRLYLSLSFMNVLGGMDQLLHGVNGLRGWGAGSMPDRTLLIQKGFDPATNQFRYEVNPRFGTTRPSLNAYRAPFQISLSGSFRLTPGYEEQSLRKSVRDAMKDGHTPAERAMSLRQGFTRDFTQMISMLFLSRRMRDSLMITDEQAESLAAIEKRFQGKADSLWVPFSERIMANGGRVSYKAEAKEIERLTKMTMNLFQSQGEEIYQVFTPDQKLRMSAMMRKILGGSEGEVSE